MNKKEKFVKMVETQIGITLENVNQSLNKNRNRLYTQILNGYEGRFISLMYELGYRVEYHYKGYFWVYL